LLGVQNYKKIEVLDMSQKWSIALLCGLIVTPLAHFVDKGNGGLRCMETNELSGTYGAWACYIAGTTSCPILGNCEDEPCTFIVINPTTGFWLCSTSSVWERHTTSYAEAKLQNNQGKEQTEGWEPIACARSMNCDGDPDACTFPGGGVAFCKDDSIASYADYRTPTTPKGAVCGPPNP
jgi:hypothetical protein